MGASQRTIDFNLFLTSTASKLHKMGAVQDAISNSNPIYAELFKSGKIKKRDVGGEMIDIPIMYQHNSTVKSYAPYGKLDITPQDGHTKAWAPWAHYAYSVVLDGPSKFKNMGKERLFDMLKAKTAQGAASVAETMNFHLLSAARRQATTAPYSGNGGLDIIGIPLWVQCFTGASDDFNVGNIDQSANTWWKNQELDFGATATYVVLKDKMLELSLDCSQGPGGKPNMFLMDQKTYQNFISSMQAQVRYMSGDTATPGFENVTHLGAKVVWDGYVPDANAGTDGVLATGNALTGGTVYALNTNTFTLYMGRDADFAPTGFQKPIDQDAVVNNYIAYLQLVCDNRKKNGVLYDVTPTLG